MPDRIPPFSAAVDEQVRRLGGSVEDVSEGAPLAERIAAVSFPRPLIDEATADVLIDRFAEEGQAAPDAVSALRSAGDDLWAAGLTWQAPGVTTPNPGLPETAELPRLDVAAHFPEALPVLAGVCGDGVREIVHLGFSESYPNYAFVRADDPHRDDPEVYTTDHEDFLREIEPEGTLSEFLTAKLTGAAIEQMVTAALS